MWELFRGRRQKFGVLTLLLSCVFMVGWFRSPFRFEYIDFSFGNVSYGVTSMHGGLDFSRMTELDPTTVLTFIDYKSVELFSRPQDPFDVTPWSAGFEIEWRWDWAGFHIGEGRYADRRDQDCMIPYWAIVIPRTLLSAFLLLFKPRQSNQKKLPEPTGNEGA